MSFVGATHTHIKCNKRLICILFCPIHPVVTAEPRLTVCADWFTLWTLLEPKREQGNVGDKVIWAHGPQFLQVKQTHWHSKGLGGSLASLTIKPTCLLTF